MLESCTCSWSSASHTIFNHVTVVFIHSSGDVKTEPLTRLTLHKCLSSHPHLPPLPPPAICVQVAKSTFVQAAMLNQPGDLSSNLLTQLGNFFQKAPPTPGPTPGQPWEGGVPPAGPFPASSSLGSGSMNGAALTGAASGLQAAAQSLLRQRMEALRQQGVGLRGAFTPPGSAPGQWDREVTARSLRL